ncbi:hypervirulence associated TUDOR domain-containing protein [Paraburkholderia antibiotica]|uniref:DUF2945 domain-containing protein n=1 Tax=Paraburkholderia antibiotica TaxID=2728839 RepID=A0A7X9ZZN3_9BURK|nr:DUF2945 domain-containing protein [Paraburkholderia antibiotica]NML33053.1 DUF2945 domain-containing protein [Paraburkholderia antibiotica]
MPPPLKLHDRVSWNTPQGITHGRIVRVISTRSTVDGKIVDGSEVDPHYEVVSEKSGRHAVHRGDALRRLKERYE